MPEMERFAVIGTYKDASTEVSMKCFFVVRVGQCAKAKTTSLFVEVTEQVIVTCLVSNGLSFYQVLLSNIIYVLKKPLCKSWQLIAFEACN